MRHDPRAQAADRLSVTLANAGGAAGALAQLLRHAAADAREAGERDLQQVVADAAAGLSELSATMAYAALNAQAAAHVARADDARQPGEVFPGSPVLALGVDPSFDVVWVRDAAGQTRSVDNLTRQRLIGLFGGRVDLLTAEFPRLSQDGRPARTWDAEAVAAAVHRACAEMGEWSPPPKRPEPTTASKTAERQARKRERLAARARAAAKAEGPADG